MASQERPNETGVDPIIERIRPWLEQKHDGSKVLLLCGCAGAGKSTLAKAVVAIYPSFNRLSIDQILFERHGLHGINYPPAYYQKYQDEANKILDERLTVLLSEGKNIVLDRALYSKEDRLDYYDICKKSGADYKLVYFSADWEFLWNRTEARRRNEINADSALPITIEMIKGYVENFDVPNILEEEHTVIDVAKYHDDGEVSK